MFQTLIDRSTWIAVWLAITGIALALNLDMKNEQPVLFWLVTVCLVVSSFALGTRRSHKRKGNFNEARAAFAIFVVCLGVVLISEISFWSSSIEGLHEQIERAQAKAKGVDLVQDKRRQQLAAHTGNQTPAAIEAQMEGELTRVYGGKTLATLTADCTDSGSPSYRYCSVFLALKSQLASAKQLVELEGKVLADSTEVVTTTVKRSFYKTAQIGSEQIGGSVQAWVAGIVIWLVLTTTVLQTLALYVGFAPSASAAPKAQPLPKANESQAQKVTGYEKPLELAPAPVVKPAITQPLELKNPPAAILDDLLPTPEPTTPDPADVAAMKAALDKLEKVKVEAPEPTPPGGGNRLPGVHLVVDNDGDGEIEDISRFFDAAPPTKAEAKGSRASKKNGVKAGAGDVETWAGLYMKPSVDPADVVSSKDAYANYEKWCKGRGLHPVHHKLLTRKLNALLGRSQGKGVRAPRNGNGTVFQGFYLTNPDQFEVKKRARA